MVRLIRNLKNVEPREGDLVAERVDVVRARAFRTRAFDLFADGDSTSQLDREDGGASRNLDVLNEEISH